MQIGPFRIERKVAEGGFGEIWSGTHTPTGLPVALKVITRTHAQDPDRYRSFLSEAQSVARLNHPGIVRVFDFGVVPPGVEPLVSGSPYLVMEFAEHGALDDALDRLDWRATRQVLEQALMALAHAHARGLVHLDMKPGNVLICGSAELDQATYRLTDFGLSRARSELPVAARPASEAESTLVFGTPAYMAPEQVTARTADYGPWTDLYGLGAMAWEFCTGAPPFEGDDARDLARRHLEEPLPAFEPLFRVPSGLEEWLKRLLRKQTHSRFRLAADALRSLRVLQPAGPTPRRPTSAKPRPAPITQDLGTGDRSQRAIVRQTPRSIDGSTESIETEPMTGVPLHWAEGGHAAAPAPLVGAGLGLFGLREVPLVARQRERDVLWGCLRRVAHTRTAAVVHLTGAAGVGKSRLGAWLAATANECGAAHVVSAAHDRSDAPLRGVQLLAGRAVGCPDVPFELALERVNARHRAGDTIDAYHDRALAELVASGGAGSDDTDPRRVRFAAAEERYAVLAHTLAELADDRPLIVWMDDVQESADTLAWVSYVLDAPPLSTLPVLLVLATQEERVRELSSVQGELQAITLHPSYVRLNIESLDRPSMHELVEQLLLLSSPLARRLVERSAGNPLFAVQLIGEWVERGALVPSADGFQLAEGVDVSLPESLHAVWEERCERALEGRNPGEIAALSLAAVLGREVRANELDAALRIGGIPPAGSLVDTWTTLGLVQPDPDGWSFAHAMLREVVLRRAEASSAIPLKELHEICAAALMEVGATSDRREQRIAMHLLAAGSDAAALEPLLHTARAHIARGEYGEAHTTLDAWDAAADRLRIDQTDARRVEPTLARADVFRREWRLGDARKAAESALALARSSGLYGARADALATLGEVARRERDFPDAEQRIFEAIGIYEVHEDFAGKARALRAMAVAAREQAQLQRAVDGYEKALNLFWTLDDQLEVANCMLGLGHVHRARRQYASAQGRYSEALAIARDLERPHLAAECTLGLAEVARYSGHIDEAEGLYRNAHETLRRLGARDAVVPRLNLAALALHRRQFDVARRELLAFLPGLDREDLRAWTLVHLLPAYAHADDMTLFDTTLAAAERALRRSRLVDTDIAETLALTADLLRMRDRGARAVPVLERAATQWNALGHPEKERELRERIVLG